MRSDGELDGPLLPVLTAGVAVLFTSRFFLPAESAEQGETLWIVVLWLVCGVAWLADAYRHGDSLRRFDWLDLGLLLLVGGQVISAVSVLMTEGHKRAALNMLWEWVGIGAAGLLIRAVMRERAGREQLLACLLASGVVLSGLGLWQHYVWYPRISQQFGELEELQQQAHEASPALSSAGRQRLTELQQELGFSFDETSQRMLRDRVQSSTEPIGRFALANTLAGLLLVSFLVGLAILRTSHSQKVNVQKLIVGGVILVLLGDCLLLTKSRTAMIGLLVGVSFGLFLMGRSLWDNRRARRAIFGVILGTGAIILAAVVSGSLDREVISETPKSLRYRMEYWTSTVDVIGEHPLLGVGPGNFRQSYLKHKLPESSEEILDPHNFVLDVWANGGLMALAGLTCLLGVTVRRSITVVRQTSANETTLDNELILNEIILRGAIGSLAMVLAALIELFQGTDIRSDWIWLAGGWWATVVLLTLVCPKLANGKLAVMAGIGLFVHLSGAGGIAMPAILQIALALIFAVDALAMDAMNPSAVVSRPEKTARLHAVMLTSIAMGLAATAACVKTAALPVTKSKLAMLEGQAALTNETNARVAVRAYELAAQIDQLSPKPFQELARVWLGQWMTSQEDWLFNEAVEAQEAAISLDPKNANGWRGMGQLWWQRFETTGNEADAHSAFSYFQHAASRYPHLAALQADVARAAQASGETGEAKQAASQALRLDNLNREFLHLDKLLAPDLLADLRKIVEWENDPDEK